MPKLKKDPFVQLVEDLLKFTPDFRQRAMALAGMHDVAPVPPASPSAPPKPPKADKVPIRTAIASSKPQKRRGRKPGSKNKPKPAGGLTPPSVNPVAQSFHSAAEQV